jgi:hypothetical protein
MPLPTALNDPAYWRQRAQEARSIAGLLDDSAAKRVMLQIAQQYEQIAAIAEKRPVARRP